MRCLIFKLYFYYNSGSRCPCGDRCANKRFQLREYPKMAVFRAFHKGCGLMAMEFIPRCYIFTIAINDFFNVLNCC